MTANDERVIYVDPYAGGEVIKLHRMFHPCTDTFTGGGYDKPADVILVTHQHGDHNKVELCTQNPDCKVISNIEALAGGKHNSFDINGIFIQAVEAKNFMHSPTKCVGYIITLDGVKIYASGDTSKTKQMETFADLKLDYAVFPGDGIFNMGLAEATACARLIGAKHNIIVHLTPGALFSRKKADKWDAPNKIIVEPGQEIVL